MAKIKWGELVGTIAVCEIAGGLGSIFTTPSIKSWYPTLHKPAFNPPNWLFGPVWVTLFVLMGIAWYLVRQQKASKKKTEAEKIFAVQLILNVIWSVLFFGLHSPLLALVEIVLLWLAITVTMKKFMKVSVTAGWLFLPYLVWVSFASILNLAIVLLN